MNEEVTAKCFQVERNTIVSGCIQCYSDINGFNDLSVRLVIRFCQIPMALFIRHKAAFVTQSGIYSLDEVASLPASSELTIH